MLTGAPGSALVPVLLGPLGSTPRATHESISVPHWPLPLHAPLGKCPASQPRGSQSGQPFPRLPAPPCCPPPRWTAVPRHEVCPPTMPQTSTSPLERKGQERKEASGVPREPVPGTLFPFGDCFPGSLEPEEHGMFLSFPRRKAFFFLHKNVKLTNPIGNLERQQLAAWILLLGTVGRRKKVGGGRAGDESC